MRWHTKEGQRNKAHQKKNNVAKRRLAKQKAFEARRQRRRQA